MLAYAEVDTANFVAVKLTQEAKLNDGAVILSAGDVIKVKPEIAAHLCRSYLAHPTTEIERPTELKP